MSRSSKESDSIWSQRHKDCHIIGHYRRDNTLALHLACNSEDAITEVINHMAAASMSCSDVTCKTIKQYSYKSKCTAQVEPTPRWNPNAWHSDMIRETMNDLS